MRLHSKAYSIKELQGKSVSDSKELAKKLGYTDKWIRKLLKKVEGSNNNEWDSREFQVKSNWRW